MALRKIVKNIAWILLGALLGSAGLFWAQIQPERAVRIQGEHELEAAFSELARAVKESGDFVQGHQWYGSEREQAEAYRHIARIMMNVLPASLLIDPDFPYFFEIGPFSKSGMDNSDQRYLTTTVNGSGTYRIWGSRGGSRRLDVSLYEQDALSGSLATLTSEQLSVEDDGSFEIILGGPSREGNWLPMQTGDLRLMVRQVHSDWADELPGEVHIDRIDESRPVYPELDRQEMAARLIEAANLLALNVRRWPEYSRTRIQGLIPVNTLTAPRPVGQTGGLAGRLMVAGHFDLASDEALLIKTWPSQATYQGIQLGHHWWESMDYANRQSSLTADQARESSDGALYFVVSESDPGVANWLDTEGFRRGVIFMRFDGLEGQELEEGREPTASLIKLNALQGYLPADEALFSSTQRAAQIATRRRHVQRRFGF
ncbi:MAG: DUF1214 domain-containing protein [Myxococcota bacterium]|nr:DUF1214 domain-containing protein [Myxococcota bacterium]